MAGQGARTTYNGVYTFHPTEFYIGNNRVCEGEGEGE